MALNPDPSFIRDSRDYLRRHWQRALMWRDKFRVSEEAFHLVLAGGVGVLGGLINLVVYYSIDWAKSLFLRQSWDPVEVAEVMAYWQRIFTPAVGGLLAGLVLFIGLRMAGPQRSGNILEVVVAGDGRLPFRRAVVKFFSSLISIGSGASVGREGAITQLSATFASKWGVIAKWPPYRLRLLVGCGAASGIAAAYNAPISGAVFAALIVLGNFSMNLFAPLVFSSVVATVVSRSFFGIHAWYTVPPFEITSLSQLPWFICLGIVSGVVGALFLKLLVWSEKLFSKLQIPIYSRLALGGLAVGLLAVPFPGVWGNGYVITNRILRGEYGAGAFSGKDIVGLPSLARKLTDKQRDGLSFMIYTNLSPSTRDLLAAYPGGYNADLSRAVARDLNRMLRSGSLYHSNLFAQVNLSPATSELLKQSPTGSDMVRANRLLLLDAFPEELSSGAREGKLLFLYGLFVAKIAATAISLGSGAVGGVFSPTLFLGAGLGALFAMVLQQLGLALGVPIPPFAIVGMGSMLAATTHSPLLSMIMVYEISSDYSLMPPLMLACVLAAMVARKLHGDSIYTEPLRRKGLTISQEANTSEAATRQTVADIMHAPVVPLRENATVSEVAERFLSSANNFVPVVDGKHQLIGIVALQDLKEYLNNGDEVKGIIAYDIMRPPPPCVTPNQRLLDVLPVVMASEQRNIPVVNTLKEYQLVGALSRAEVLSIFSEAIAISSKSED